MEARPVTRIAVPQYPTRLKVLENPDLLRKHMPSAWKSCLEMAGAVAVLLTANQCLAQQAKPGDGKAGVATVVAPIFEHGEGRGATGCVAILAPVFLSEQDAMQVIREELQNAGVELTDSSVPLPEVSIPEKAKRLVTKEDGQTNIEEVPTGISKPMVLQGFDPGRRVAVEVVQIQNYSDLADSVRVRDETPATPKLVAVSSVRRYDFKGVAKELRDRVAATDQRMFLGTFYEPAPSQRDLVEEFDKTLQDHFRDLGKTADPALRRQKQKEFDEWSRGYDERRRSEVREQSQRLLRMQVKDFIDWLKAQGVI